MKKKRQHNNSPEEDKDTSMVSKENECPYCDFQCKRASALKFHIDLKHKGEKKSVEKRKAEEHVDSTQKKKSKLVEITVDSPGKDTVNDRRGKKLQVKKLDDKTSKATNKTPEPDERKENIQKFKGRSSKKHDDEIDQPERVFIINKKGMQETPKKKVPTIQKKAQKTHTENCNVAKNGKEYECQKFSKVKMNGEKVFLEEGANEEDENIEEDNDTTDDDDGDEDDDCVEKTSDIDSDAENVSYICPVCSREFRLLHAVKQHIKARHPSQEIRNCDIISLIPKLINKTTKSKVIANEKESKSSVKTIPSSTRKVICPFCKLSADHMVDIRAHIEAVHKNKDIQDICNKTGNVLEHGVSKENVEIKMQNKTSTSVLHKCPFCNLGFMLKHEFTAHVRNAHGNKHDMLQSCDKEQAPGVGSHKIPEEKGISAHRQLKSQVCSSDAKAKKKDGNKSTEPEETNVTIIKLCADKNGDFKDVSALGDDHKQNEVDSIETDAKPERRILGKVKSKSVLNNSFKTMKLDCKYTIHVGID